LGGGLHGLVVTSRVAAGPLLFTRKHLPAAVLVSIGCSGAFKETPLAFTARTMSCRSPMLRARRSIRVTISVSPGCRKPAQFRVRYAEPPWCRYAVKAKLAGVYKGRKRSVDIDAVRSLKAEGVGPAAIAKRLGVARASVYRALALT
jgi:hypothetical protein